MYIFCRLLGGGAGKLCMIQCWSRLLHLWSLPLNSTTSPPAGNYRNPIVYRPWGFCLMHHVDPFCTHGFGRDEMIMRGTFWQNFTDTIRKIEMEVNEVHPLFCTAKFSVFTHQSWGVFECTAAVREHNCGCIISEAQWLGLLVTLTKDASPWHLASTECWWNHMKSIIHRVLLLTIVYLPPFLERIGQAESWWITIVRLWRHYSQSRDEEFLGFWCPSNCHSWIKGLLYEYVRMGNVRFTSNLGKGPFLGAFTCNVNIICSKSQHFLSLECSLKRWPHGKFVLFVYVVSTFYHPTWVH